jgi:hypothetical protein
VLYQAYLIKERPDLLISREKVTEGLYPLYMGYDSVMNDN